jgi:Fe-S cluster assembly ATP-binding protein
MDPDLRRDCDKGKRKTMFEIKNLHASIGDKQILKGMNLTLEAGKVHAVMGPNGAGKSTLSYVLSGRPDYEVTEGSVTLNGQDILEMSPEDRAAAGIFLAFQYPVEIPGVQTMTFLKTAMNAVRRARGEPEMDPVTFLKTLRATAEKLGVKDEMLKRPLNVGFSGGEKKRMEILQMAMLTPRVIIMDETDSGLDIDALKIVADGVNALRAPDRTFLIITHYQRLLDYIVPDAVHVLADGKIVKTGDANLAKELEETGYDKHVSAA